MGIETCIDEYLEMAVRRFPPIEDTRSGSILREVPQGRKEVDNDSIPSLLEAAVKRLVQKAFKR